MPSNLPATFQSSPDIEEGVRIEPKNACGEIVYTYEGANLVKRHNLSGELYFFDPEAAFVMFGGEVLLGASAGDYAGKAIGWASPNYTDAPTNGVYLEIITTAIGEGAGDCQTSADAYPPYIGHIWGKAKLTLGDRTFEEDAARVTFTGTATGNPNLFDGPWNDYPIEGEVANTPYQYVGYSQAEFDTILADAGPGCADLPTAS
jgi:hypothetical protein